MIYISLRDHMQTYHPCHQKYYLGIDRRADIDSAQVEQLTDVKLIIIAVYRHFISSIAGDVVWLNNFTARQDIS